MRLRQYEAIYEDEKATKVFGLEQSSVSRGGEVSDEVTKWSLVALERMLAVK